MSESVELIDAEREAVADKLTDEPFTGPEHPMWGVIESIVAARVQALTAEVARMKDIYRCHELGRLESEAERDAARAELAAANARNRELEREIDERDKAHEGIVATITAAARADTRTAKSDAAKVQMLAERVDALRLSRDKHRNRAAALQARCAELDRDVKNVTRWAMTRESERDALQATLDRVTAEAIELQRENAVLRTDISTCQRMAREAADHKHDQYGEDYDPNGRTNEWY